jgi:hypothetical protein
MQIIEQSTSITIRIGPFVDEDDGKTAETGLTITQADIRLSKNGGAFAQSNDSGGATHDESGWYYLTLDATDTGTLGRLIVAIHESGALPVWREFMVMTANVWDSLVGGTDYLQADTVQIEGVDATDQINAACDTALADYDPPTKAEMDSAHSATDGLVTTVDGVADAIKAVTDNLPDSGALTSLAQASDLATVDGVADAIKAVTDNLPDSGALTSLAQASDLATVDSNVDAILADTGTDGVVLADNAITAAKVATGAIDADALAADAGTEIADAILTRDWTSVSGEAARSVLNALRFLRNKWSISGSTLTVTEEDDSTSAWTATLTTDSGADPITASDPT